MGIEEDKKPFIIFGRDVTQIPCFKKSFLYGFGGGIVGGLATFMFTSTPRLASHLGVASFVGTTWSYWTYCRYNWSKQKLVAAELQALMEQHATLRRTPTEKDVDGAESLILVEA